MRKHRVILIFLLTLTVVTIAAGIFVLEKWNRPLGSALNLPTYTQPTNINPSHADLSSLPVSQETSDLSDQDLTASSGFNSPHSLTPVASPTAALQPVCNGPATMAILLIGSDARSTGYLYGLADSIHIVRIDFTVPNIMVIDFPRDLWVEIPDISDHYGITHGKLNQAYLFGNPGMGYYDGPGEGPGLLARTLDLNFGLRADHYLAINRQTFVRMIDAVGGVDISLDSPINLNQDIGTPDPKLYLTVGKNHLDGEHALDLAVNRIPTTFQRMKYQKIILSALREQLLSPAMLPKLPKLVTQFISSVQTDLSPSQISSLICIAQAVPKSNIRVDSFPEKMFTAGVTYDQYRNVTTFVYNTDFDMLRAMVSEFMAGIWPMPEADPSATPQP